MDEQERTSKDPSSKLGIWLTAIGSLTAFLVALSALIYNSTDLLKQSKDILFQGDDQSNQEISEGNKIQSDVWHAWIAFPFRNDEFCLDFSKEFFKDSGYSAEEFFPNINTIVYKKDDIKLDARCISRDYLGSSYLLFLSASRNTEALAALHKRASAKFALTDVSGLNAKYFGNPEWYHQVFLVKTKGNSSPYLGNNDMLGFDSGVDMGFIEHLKSQNFILQECGSEFCRLQKDGAILIITAAKKTENPEDPTEVSFGMISSSGFLSISGKKNFQLSSRTLHEMIQSYEKIVSSDHVVQDWN